MADVVTDIGVLGGSGLDALLADARTVEVDTPYGAPSAPVVVGGPRLSVALASLPASQGDCSCASALDGLHPDPTLP